jgi:rhamnosyltransferase
MLTHPLPSSPPSLKLPRIAVLMATLNGEKWICDQIDTILSQLDVSVELFLSDDGSTDGTVGLVRRLAISDARIHLTINPQPRGYAAANFFYMVRTLDLTSFDLVAFTDQDDLWFCWKLAKQAEQLRAHGADGVSSDVIAYWSSNNKAHYIRKATPQRRFDFVFESPGPGCTMVITPRLLKRFRERLNDRNSRASQVGYHDWLVYAVARASGWVWHIGSEPTLLYIQHETNELGANRGILAVCRRLVHYSRGRFASDCRAILSVAQECAAIECRELPGLRPIDILRDGRRQGWHRFLVALLFPFGLFARNTPDQKD